MSKPQPAIYTFERRASPRMVTNIAAKVFPGGLDCTIVDLSDRGARLRMDPPCRAGDDVLVVEWESGRAYDGQVVWTQGLESGMRFIRTCLLSQRIPTPFAEAKAAWDSSRPRQG